MSCQVRDCVVRSWGHVGPHAIPHAPTELAPYTASCLEKCAKCGRGCVKANGHQWSCSCHRSDCHEPSCRYCGRVIPAARNGRCLSGPHS
jgi:hypothetical protein